MASDTNALVSCRLARTALTTIRRAFAILQALWPVCSVHAGITASIATSACQRVSWAAVVLLPIAVSLSAEAAPPAGNAPETAQHPNEILLIAAYGKSDTRETETEYAKSHGISLEKLQQSVSSAVGEIRCGTAVANATLTANSSVIATVGHIFCHALVPKCSFKYFYSGKTNTIFLRNEAISPYDCDNKKDQDDWAVARLQSPVFGPTPLKINAALANKIVERGRDAKFIAQGSIDFCAKDRFGTCIADPKTKRFVYPKYIVDCLVMDTSKNAHGDVMQYVTNCPGSIGASGGAIIDNTGDVAFLLGVQASIQGTPTDVAWEKQNGKPIIRPFSMSEPTWFQLSVAVSGNFARAIEKMAGTTAAKR